MVLPLRAKGALRALYNPPCCPNHVRLAHYSRPGGAYPAINHSPWNGVTLADIVMPWFLFMVGASMSMSLRKYLRGGRADRIAGTKACMLRALFSAAAANAILSSWSRALHLHSQAAASK